MRRAYLYTSAFLAAMALPATARATELGAHPLHRLVDRERPPHRIFPSIPHPPGIGFGAISTMDLVHARHDLDFDPSTGQTRATLDLEVRATRGSLAQIGFTIDQGLAIAAVTADGGRTVKESDTIYAPTRAALVEIDPPLADGESTTIHVEYAGTLACGSYPESGAPVCTKGDFAYLPHQSILPYFFDPLAADDTTFDGMTRDIVLRVPIGTDVAATGELVSDTVEADRRVATWTIDRPLSRTLGMYVFAGKLGRWSIDGRSVPTTLVYPAPAQPVDDHLREWSAPVLDFVEGFVGTRLPFQRSMTLVHLPADVGDPGTATYGMTLLSDSYARAGDLMHEETWAHENTHLFWGIVVPETDPSRSRMMSEGLATLSEIEYTWSHHYGTEDREAYLARRFSAIGMDLRGEGKDILPILLAPGQNEVSAYGTPAYTMWAYEKTAATLDHLRATIGDDVFAKALGRYLDRCAYVGCGAEDMLAALEETSGKDLHPFFDRWVTSTARPHVTIGFTPKDGGGADIELGKADDSPMTLELWLRLDDGQLVKQRVDLAGTTTRTSIATSARVRSVQANPRHDVMVEAVSSVPGDLDFDGETDGFDVLRCTRYFGTKPGTASVGLWNTDSSFDPHCDLDGNGKIDDEDLAAITRNMGKVR